jgi:hypothetical protein
VPRPARCPGTAAAWRDDDAAAPLLVDARARCVSCSASLAPPAPTAPTTTLTAQRQDAHPPNKTKTTTTANPRQNARLYEKYEANRRAFGGEPFDSSEADARTLRWLRRTLLESDADANVDPGPLLVDPRRVAAMAEFYRVLPDEADDPEYAELPMTRRRRGAAAEANNVLSPPPPLPPRSLPDCLSARDPVAAAELDARVRAGGGGVFVRGAVVRPLEKQVEDEDRWRRRAAEALAGQRQQQQQRAPSATTAAFVLWDVESAPLPPDADPRAAARLLEALAEEVLGLGAKSGDGDDARPSVHLSAFGARPALSRIPDAFVANYAVEGGSTSRSAAASTAATSLGAGCAAYYSSRGLLFAPTRGAQPSLRYALRREGCEVVQVGGGGRGGGDGGGKKKKTKKRSNNNRSSSSNAQAALAPADALAAAAERLLSAQARLRARALFFEEEGEQSGPNRAPPAPPSLLLVVVAGAGELEATGLRRRLQEEQVQEGGIVPLLVVAGGGGGGGKADSSPSVLEVSWEGLLLRS